MKTYKIFTVSDCWSLKKLREKSELLLNELSKKGWQVLTVSTTYNWWNGAYVNHVTAYKAPTL